VIDVLLLPVGSVAPGLMDRLADSLRRSFPWMRSLLDDAPVDPGFAFDRTRNQYRSDLLLEALSGRTPGHGTRIVGIAEVDLFIPVFTFVFGEAHLDGPAAVVSLHRLRPEVYGLPADDDRFLRRAVTEVAHELGHTFGLRHCRDYACAMHASRSADDIDLKGPDFCQPCEGVVRDRLPPPVPPETDKG